MFIYCSCLVALTPGRPLHHSAREFLRPAPHGKVSLQEGNLPMSAGASEGAIDERLEDWFVEGFHPETAWA